MPVGVFYAVAYSATPAHTDDIHAAMVESDDLEVVTQNGGLRRKGHTILVGDTPRDVRAGRDGGARVVAVATGSDSVESLRAAGADVVLPDLLDTKAVAEAVTSLVG